MTPAQSVRPPIQLPLAVLAALPGSYLGLASYFGLPSVHVDPPLLALAYGAAIVGAAFLLSWAAEAAQVDISAGLALALLAFLAVLPEYAVDLVFTWQAGDAVQQYGKCVPPGSKSAADPCSLALANMTGANRILVGVGWPLVVLIAAVAAKRNPQQAAETPDIPKPGQVQLQPAMSAEVAFLGFATLYSLTLPLKSTLTLWDTGVLVLLFGGYAWRLAKAPVTEPELLGTSAWMGEQDRRRRRFIVIGFFVVAAVVILLSAEHFAEALVDTGSELGIDEFLLVQWLAPMASESPELIIACLYAWRLKASDSLGTLLSSKVNQWTLLVGTIPLVFAISAFGLAGLPLDTNQRLELLITAAQSFLAVALLIDLHLSRRSAVLLIGLFLVQFLASLVLSGEINRWILIVLSAVYLLLGAGELVRKRHSTLAVIRDGTVTPFDRLERENAQEGAG